MQNNTCYHSQSPPLSLRKAILPPTHCLCQFAGPMGWMAWLARTHVYLHYCLRVITLYAQLCKFAMRSWKCILASKWFFLKTISQWHLNEINVVKSGYRIWLWFSGLGSISCDTLSMVWSRWQWEAYSHWFKVVSFI